MKKLLTLTSITLVSMSTLLGTGITTFANDEPEVHHGVETPAKIEFTEGDEVTEVIPPGVGPDVNPTPAPGPEDEDGIHGVNKGPLTIAYVPTLNFGSQVISAQTQTYEMIAELQPLRTNPTELVPFVSFAQVQDTRGTNEGWILRVSKTAFTTEDESALNKTLRGTRLTFVNGNLEYNDEQDPQEQRPSISEKFTLEPGSNNIPIMTAAKNQGGGTSTLVWGDQADLTSAKKTNDNGDVLNDAIQLEIPGSSTRDAVAYEATLTWELLAAPGQVID